MPHVGESSTSAEVTEPLLSQEEHAIQDNSIRSPSITITDSHGMYKNNPQYNSATPSGFMTFLRQQLGIFSYRDPSLMNKPRKIPMRVEPKTYFALERTFLNWMTMSVTIATLSTTLLGFSFGSGPQVTPTSNGLTPKSLQLIACLLLPVGVVILLYSIWVYNQRVSALKAKEMRFFEDRLSPVLLTVTITLSMSALFFVRLVDFLSS
mmetsp:Transcript_25618/g.71637  ORF Transcript_25618/g.71637 Transcript_25618/m.71637 type:complete len:208 (-) Transcript_25618:1174-1797(-)